MHTDTETIITEMETIRLELQAHLDGLSDVPLAVLLEGAGQAIQRWQDILRRNDDAAGRFTGRKDRFFTI